MSDFNTTNCDVSNLTTVTAGTAYTVDVVAIAGGDVTLELAAGSVNDEAGNENAVASVTYTYETGDIVNDLTGNVIKLYPNPAGDHINIELSREATITITYMTGKIAMVKENVLKDIIDISRFPRGIYLMHIETSEGVSIHKIVKE